MVNIELIETSINQLENSGMNYEICRNLAALYSIRDHYYNSLRVKESYGDSEFLQTVVELPIQEVLVIIDELMEVTKVMNTRVYNSIINRLKEIRAG